MPKALSGGQEDYDVFCRLNTFGKAVFRIVTGIVAIASLFLIGWAIYLFTAAEIVAAAIVIAFAVTVFIVTVCIMWTSYLDASEEETARAPASRPKSREWIRQRWGETMAFAFLIGLVAYEWLAMKLETLAGTADSKRSAPYGSLAIGLVIALFITLLCWTVALFIWPIPVQ